MSKIPMARELLEGIVSDFDNMSPREVKDTINVALNMMTREYTKPRAKASSMPVTGRTVSLVKSRYRQMQAQGIEPSIQELADTFGVNPGRISEILAGKR